MSLQELLAFAGQNPILSLALVLSPLILLLWWLWKEPKAAPKTTTMSS